MGKRNLTLFHCQTSPLTVIKIYTGDSIVDTYGCIPFCPPMSRGFLSRDVIQHSARLLRCFFCIFVGSSSHSQPRCHSPTLTTHTFNGPLSGTTQVSWYQKGKINLDFTEARDSGCQWHQLGRMQVCTSLQTDKHTWMLFLLPNQQRQSTKGITVPHWFRHKIHHSNNVTMCKDVPFYDHINKR